MRSEDTDSIEILRWVRHNHARKILHKLDTLKVLIAELSILQDLSSPIAEGNRPKLQLPLNEGPFQALLEEWSKHVKVDPDFFQPKADVDLDPDFFQPKIDVLLDSGFYQPETYVNPDPGFFQQVTAVSNPISSVPVAPYVTEDLVDNEYLTMFSCGIDCSSEPPIP